MSRSGQPALSWRPVLTRAEAADAVRRLRTLLGPDADRVILEHNARAVLEIANNTVLDGTVGSELTLTFPMVLRTANAITVGTNQLDDQLLSAVAAQVAALRSSPPADSTAVPPPDTDAQELVTFRPQPAMPVALWHEATVAAMTQPPAVAATLMTKMRQAQLVGAATMALSARATYYSYPEGLEAWAEETDAEVTVTARLPDGTASGWAGGANRDVSAIAWEPLIARAMDLAERGRHPVAIEPGRYTAILGPAAVGQLARLMASFFDYAAAYSGGPFHDQWSPSRTKLGQRVFDERLRLVSDPTDPAGGFTPFYEMSNSGWDVGASYAGIPIPKMTWVEGGVLANLAYDPPTAAQHRKPWAAVPTSLRIEAMPGTATATVDEMIAQCEFGIYVNRLSDVTRLFDTPLNYNMGMTTGTTRDGCFLVKGGEIVQPIRNFRFIESPFQVLARLLMVGQTERIAYGYATMTEEERDSALWWPPLGHTTRWPRVPMIVPPMMVRDFNFTSLADAV